MIYMNLNNKTRNVVNSTSSDFELNLNYKQ